MEEDPDAVLTHEEQARVAQMAAHIEERAVRGGPWPARLGPVGPERRVFEALRRKAIAAGWDAEFEEDDTLVITVLGHLSGPNGG
jgi:hypothetical protein